MALGTLKIQNFCQPPKMYQTGLCVFLEPRQWSLIDKFCPRSTDSKGFAYHSANYFLQYKLTSQSNRTNLNKLGGEKSIRETRSNGRMRARGNHVARRDYNNAIRGSSSDYELLWSSLRQSTTNRSHHERRKIRRRLKHKHHSAIPVHLKWVQFMHSEIKNRKYSALALRCRC
jgi:hypothetical protein